MSDRWTALWSSTQVKDGGRKQILIETTLQKNSATTDKGIYTESHSLEKERYLPESEQSSDTCASGPTTWIRSWKVWVIAPPRVSFDVLHVQVCVYRSVYVGLSVKPLFTLEFKNPIKSSTVPVLPGKWHSSVSFDFIFPALVPISLPVFPWLSLLASHPPSSLPTCSFGFLLSVTCYLSLPVNFFFLCRVPA